MTRSAVPRFRRRVQHLLPTRILGCSSLRYIPGAEQGGGWGAWVVGGALALAAASGWARAPCGVCGPLVAGSRSRRPLAAGTWELGGRPPDFCVRKSWFLDLVLVLAAALLVAPASKGRSSSFSPSLNGRSTRQTASTRVGELSIRYMRPFTTSPTDIYSYGTTVHMSILSQPIMRGVQIMPSSRVARSTGSQ